MPHTTVGTAVGLALLPREQSLPKKKGGGVEKPNLDREEAGLGVPPRKCTVNLKEATFTGRDGNGVRRSGL